MDSFVSPDWLADNLGDVRVVDVRDAWEYDGIGHIPTAVSIPFEAFRNPDGGQGMLPGVEHWTDLLSATGITAGDDIVAYDDTHGVFAARFLVTAELYGHDTSNLHLLDGDYSAWSREREVTRESVEPEPTEYGPNEPELAESEPVESESVDSTDSPLVSFEEVDEALDDPETAVVDIRERWEYEEAHLPGAVQLDWMELVDTDSRGLKSREELKSVLADRGIMPEKRILLYCNTARRISHTYLVLRHLGYERLAFYEGSLTEWEERGGKVESRT